MQDLRCLVCVRLLSRVVMKKIYKCIFEILLGLIIVALCVFVFNFSLLGMESYILHYPQWLLGHCLAVLFLLCLFLFLLTICNYLACNNLRISIKKASKFIFLVSLIIFAYIAIIGIDYGLLFHQSKSQDDDKEVVGDFSSDQLVGTCWLRERNAKNTKTWMRFYRSTIFYDDIIDSEIIEEKSGNRISKSCYKIDYYLSVNMAVRFDKSKVGKRTSGRYLVEKKTTGETRCVEIYMLTPTRLYLVDGRDTTVFCRVDPYPALITSDDLKGDAWQEQDLPLGIRRTYTFLDSIMIDSAFNDNSCKVNVSTATYYLEDTIPPFFDSSQVGKKVRGRYIVMNRNGKLDVSMINDVDRANLILKDSTIRKYIRPKPDGRLPLKKREIMIYK